MSLWPRVARRSMVASMSISGTVTSHSAVTGRITARSPWEKYTSEAVTRKPMVTLPPSPRKIFGSHRLFGPRLNSRKTASGTIISDRNSLPGCPACDASAYSTSRGRAIVDAARPSMPSIIL